MASNTSQTELMAERFKAARQSAKLTLRVAAKRIGVVYTTLAGWESGERTPRALYIFAMAKLYRCSADYLLGLTEHATSLPMGVPLIDQSTVDRILQAKTPEELADLVDWEPQMIWFWCTLGTKTRPATPRQVQALSFELASHFRKVAPHLWREFENAARQLRGKRTKPPANRATPGGGDKNS